MSDAGGSVIRATHLIGAGVKGKCGEEVGWLLLMNDGESHICGQVVSAEGGRESPKVAAVRGNVSRG